MSCRILLLIIRLDKLRLSIREQIQQMKQSHEVNLQASSPKKMRAEIKENEVTITKLNGSIKKKRLEMKQFSQEMTKMLEKKLIPKNQSQYSHPNFNPQFADPHHQSLHQEKESIFLQINKIKQKISELLAEEEPEVINQIRKKEAILQKLNKQQAATLKQRELLKEALEKNRQILQNYKESQCLKQIQENQQQLQQIKKEIRQLDKDLKNWMTQEINMGMYTAETEKKIEQMQNMKIETPQIDHKIIQDLIQEITAINEDKKIADRQFLAKKEQIIKKIKEISLENQRIDQKIRQITHQQLQKDLAKKRKETITKNKSLPQITHIEKKKQPRISKPNQKQTIFNTPSLLLTQPLDPPQTKPRKNEQKTKETQTIMIGNWRTENHIKDDIIETRNISRAVSMKIRTKDKKITGIGVTYIDKRGVQILGRSNIWKLSEDKLENGEEEYVVDLEDVVALYYYSPITAESTNGQNSTIGLKFMSKSSRPVIKIGEFLNEEEIQFVELENQYIRTVEFTLDNSYKSISGIKLCLQKINQPPKKTVFQQQIEDNIPEIGPSGLKKNEDLMPSKWLNTTSQAGLTQKKVFIKSQSLSKKLNQVSQVDHRLMLNRKKKMV